MVDVLEAVIVVIVFAIVIVGILVLLARRYKKVPPDRAMVVYGKRQRGKAGRGYQVISGGAKFIVPILESYEFIALGARPLPLVVNEIVTDVKESGAKVNIKATAQVKVSSDAATLDTAAEHLLHKSDAQID